MSRIEVTKIVTHPGTAHKDEFLAICLVLHKTSIIQVERRNVSGRDLQDPSTLVIDIGEQFDPSLNNFDHHQDASLPSSFHLIARHYNLDKSLERSAKWYPTIDVDDRKGPSVVAQTCDLSVAQLETLADPIGISVLGLFSHYEVVPLEFVSLMKQIGERIAVHAQQYELDWDKLAKIKVREIEGIRYLIDADDENIAREDYARLYGVAIVVKPSNRGTGWSFRRMDDHSAVDFRRVKELPDFDSEKHHGCFIHASGFFAVSTNAFANIEEIVRASLESSIRPDFASDPSVFFDEPHPP